MDFSTLVPALEMVGTELGPEETVRATELLDSENSGIEEIEGYIAQGSAAAVFRAADGFMVAVLRWAHSPEQFAEAEKFREDYKRRGINLDGHTIEQIVGRGDNREVISIYSGYGDERTAKYDGRRALLRQTIENGTFSVAAGWMEQVVSLVNGVDYFYILRTRTNGKIDIEYRENVLNAYACYAECLEKLTQDLIGYGKKSSLPPGTRDIVSAWLRREGADALLAQARHNLTGALKIYKLMETQPHSVSELARNLYTDRGNLSKAFAKAANS